MLEKQAKATPTVARSTALPKEDPLACEMWLTGDVDHGPAEEADDAERLFLEKRHRRGSWERLGNKPVKKDVST
jgi:hypothetical protein